MHLRHLLAPGLVLVASGCGTRPAEKPSSLVVVSVPAPIATGAGMTRIAAPGVQQPGRSASAPGASPESATDEPASMPADAAVYAEKRRDPYHLDDVAFD